MRGSSRPRRSRIRPCAGNGRSAASAELLPCPQSLVSPSPPSPDRRQARPMPPRPDQECGRTTARRSATRIGDKTSCRKPLARRSTANCFPTMAPARRSGKGSGKQVLAVFLKRCVQLLFASKYVLWVSVDRDGANDLFMNEVHYVWALCIARPACRLEPAHFFTAKILEQSAHFRVVQAGPAPPTGRHPQVNCSRGEGLGEVVKDPRQWVRSSVSKLLCVEFEFDRADMGHPLEPVPCIMSELGLQVDIATNLTSDKLGDGTGAVMRVGDSEKKRPEVQERNCLADTLTGRSNGELCDAVLGNVGVVGIVLGNAHCKANLGVAVLLHRLQPVKIVARDVGGQTASVEKALQVGGNIDRAVLVHDTPKLNFDPAHDASRKGYHSSTTGQARGRACAKAR